MYDQLLYQSALEKSAKITEAVRTSYRRQRPRIVENLCDIFTEHINMSGIQNRFTEHMVEEIYFPMMENRINKMKEELEENLVELTEVFIRKVKSDPSGLRQYAEQFEYEATKLEKIFKSDAFEEVNQEFLSEFTRTAANKFGDLGSRVEDEIRYEIKGEMTQYLNRTTENILDESRSYVKDQIEETVDTLDAISDIIEYDQEKANDKAEKLSEQQLKSFAKLFGYNLEVNGKKGILTSGGKYPRSFEVNVSEHGLTSSSDEYKAGLRMEDGELSFTDPRTKKKITVSPKSEVKIESLSSNRVSEIRNNNGKIEYVWNGKVLKNAAQQIVVINEIENHYPDLYTKITENQLMKESIESVKSQDKENELVGPGVQINPNNREEFIKRMFVAGYNIEEKDGQVFAIDCKTGEKDRLVETDYGYLSLEHNNKVSIATQLTFIDQNITTNHMQVRNGDKHLMINNRFNYFSYRDYGTHQCARIEINEDNEIKFSGENMSAAEAQQLFEREYPNVIKFVNQKVRWEGFKIVDENEKDITAEVVETQETKNVQSSSIDSQIDLPDEIPEDTIESAKEQIEEDLEEFGIDEIPEDTIESAIEEGIIVEDGIDEIPEDTIESIEETIIEEELPSEIPEDIPEDIIEGIEEDLPEEIEEIEEDTIEDITADLFEELEEDSIEEIPEDIIPEVSTDEMMEELQTEEVAKDEGLTEEQKIDKRLQELSQDAAVKEFLALLALKEVRAKMGLREGENLEESTGRKL